MGGPPGGGVQAPHLLSGHAARPGAHLSGSTAPLPCGQGGSPSRPPAAPALPFCPPSSSSAAPPPPALLLVLARACEAIQPAPPSPGPGTSPDTPGPPAFLSSGLPLLVCTLSSSQQERGGCVPLTHCSRRAWSSHHARTQWSQKMRPKAEQGSPGTREPRGVNPSPTGCGGGAKATV